MAILETRKYKCSDSNMPDGTDVIHSQYVLDESVFQGFNIVIFPLAFKSDFHTIITATRNIIKDMVVLVDTTKYLKHSCSQTLLRKQIQGMYWSSAM